MATLHEIHIETKSRMLGMLEEAMPDHPAIPGLTLEIIQMHSKADVQDTDDIFPNN